MSTEITITLPDEVYQNAERFAHLANRDIASVLADAIHQAIPLTKQTTLDLEPISTIPDDTVLALTQLEMDPDDDARLSQLLNYQQAGLLSDEERTELQQLMQLYQEGLLRKATALAEAVKRGLMEPLES